MEDLEIRAGRGFQARDGSALGIAAGVALGSHHHAQGRPGIPAQCGLGQFAIQGRLAQGRQVGSQAHHDRLRFRVAEPTVEFDHLGVPIRGDHQAGIQEAQVRSTFGSHARQRGF